VTEEEAYFEVSAYTLTHGDAAFIHQHVVDAYAIQHASDKSKPIGVAFALIGLYLQLERGFTGRQVQLAHMQLARTRRVWPTFTLPDERGDMTALDVIVTPEGAVRDEAIHAWCRSVWEACSATRDDVIHVLREHRII
jgi:hypothetical protein